MHKKLLFFSALLALGSPAMAQVSVTATLSTPSASYTTLKGAFDAINAGTHQGIIAISLTGNTTETATASLNASGTGSALYTTISIAPDGGARSITGAMPSGSSLINLLGADNVTINGLNTGGSSLTIENTTASGTTNTSTILLQGGATGNTITNCFLKGAGYIFSAGNGGVVYIADDLLTANGNDNNTISNNDIGPSGSNLPSRGIYANGSTTSTAIGNSGISITGNHIHDCFLGSSASAAVMVMDGNNSWIISNNHIYQTATRAFSAVANNYGIYLTGTTANAGIQNMEVSGNIIGYADASQTGTYTLNGNGKFKGINLTGIPGGTQNRIRNNTISAVLLNASASSGTGISGPINCIAVTSGPTAVVGNAIGSQSATGSLALSTTATSATDMYAILFTGPDNGRIDSNIIGGLSITGTNVGMALRGIRRITAAAPRDTIRGNVVGGTVANSMQATGLASSTATGVIGILHESSTLDSCARNIIRNLTVNGGTGSNVGNNSIVGLQFAGSSASLPTVVVNNTIYGLRNTNTTLALRVNGLYCASTSTLATNLVAGNRIYDLSTASNNANAVIRAIYINSGTATYANNMVSVGENSPAVGVIYALYDAAGVSNSFYHNSLYVIGTNTSSTYNESIAFHGLGSGNRSWKNNIFINVRSNSGGTGTHYAIATNATGTPPVDVTSDYNVIHATGNGAMFGYYGVDQPSLAAWQAASGLDANSIAVLPPFTGTTDLHLTNSEGYLRAPVVPGVLTDVDGDARILIATIGADETACILNTTTNPIPVSNTTVAATQSGTQYYATCDQGLLAVLTSSGTAPVSGLVTARVLVQGSAPTYNGAAYVRRSYDITPATNADAATATVTLYYTQADFDNYNASNGSEPDLPANPTDATGIANFKLTQQHGTSVTGLPGSYTGYSGTGSANVVIDPADNNIVWNGAANRWEVTFDVVGFSGFFAYGSSSAVPLPVDLVSLTAQANGPANLVSWVSAGEQSLIAYEVERSSDGLIFRSIGRVAAYGGAHAYTYPDNSPLAPVSYYRLRMADADGTYRYSSTVSVARGADNGTVLMNAYPNPANDQLNVRVDGAAAAGRIALCDLSGRVLMTATLNGGAASFNTAAIPSGTYLAVYEGGGVKQVTKVTIAR